MVEISKSGSGEGLGWETGRGYSTIASSRTRLISLLAKSRKSYEVLDAFSRESG